MMPVHLLDLEPAGHVLPHVDHSDYCGDFIVGLSLLTDSLMTLHRTDSAGIPLPPPHDAWLPMHLPRRSLYVLTGAARHEWAHAVPNEPPKGRRLALILRDRARGAADVPRWRKWKWGATDAKSGAS